MILISEDQIEKSSQYLKMEVCVGRISWNTRSSVSNNKLLGIPNRIEVGDINTCSGRSDIIGSSYESSSPKVWEILLPYFCSRLPQNMLPRVWWIFESPRVGKVGMTILTCRWTMCTNWFQQSGVLGLIALGCY